MATEKDLRKKKKWPFWFKVLLVLMLIIVILTGIVSFKLNDIAGQLIKAYNNRIEGELEFTSISVNPIEQFPHTTIIFNDFSLSIDRKNDLNLQKDTLLQLSQFAITVNLFKLIDGEIEVIRSSMDNGFLHLIKEEQGNFSFLRAFGKKEVLKDSSMKMDTEASLWLDLISFKNIRLILDDQQNKISLDLEVDALDSKISIQGDSISCRLHGEALIRNLSFPKFTLENRNLVLQSELLFHKKQELLLFEETILSLDEFGLKFQGSWAMGEVKQVDIDLEAIDMDFGLLGLIMSREGMKQIKSGSSYLKGSIKGSYHEEIPEIDIVFGLDDVRIDIPKYQENISDLNLVGDFKSGRKRDLSDAVLNLDHLKAQLPGGYLNAKLRLNNFDSPQLNYLLDLQTELKGMDQVFRIQDVKDLRGQLKVYEQFEGVYNDSLAFFDGISSESNIILNRIAFKIPDVITVDSLSGEFHRTEARLNISKLNLYTPHSALQLSGWTDTYLDLFVGKEKEIEADLDIKVSSLDIPAEFAWAPGVANGLPFILHNASLKVKMHTSTDQLLNFENYPKLAFELRDFKTNVEGVEAVFGVKNGKLLICEKGTDLKLEFKNFNAFVDEGAIFANATFSISDSGSSDLNLKGQLKGLDPSRFIPEKKDSLADPFRGKLYGDLSASIHFEKDTFHMNQLAVETNRMRFINEDTLKLSGLSIKADSVYFGPPLSAISFRSTITAENILSKGLNLIDVHYDILAKAGEFKLDPHQLKLFGKEGNGHIAINPFVDQPQYDIEYSVKGFSSEHLLERLNREPLLIGNMDLEVDLSVDGMYQKSNNLLKNLNGYLVLSATDLKLEGLDFDNFLKKYRKSQKFDLTDLGAIAIAGPIGLAITKGSDFAALAIGDKGEVTQINQLISDIEIENGKLLLKDVAFATKENRIAVKGWVDFPSDSLDIVFAVLDVNGCAVLEQEISGSIEDPEKSDVKLLGTLIGPITNLISGSLGGDCEVFYKGSVAHPSK